MMNPFFFLFFRSIFSHIFPFGFAPMLILYNTLYLSKNKVYVVDAVVLTWSDLYKFNQRAMTPRILNES